jgi:Phenylacetic acid-responsive transcriptional repressor
MIFFDIEELQRRKRDELRRYLKQLGLKQMQESVWISPWEVRDEVKYLREILGIADEVKWGILSEIENDEDLKKWFELK